MVNSFVAEGTAWYVMVVPLVVVVMMVVIIFEWFPKLSPSYRASGGCCEQ